jgi:hypothetical protein
MHELEIWNFAVDFTAEEAASLIFGGVPGTIELNRLQPILQRLRRCYHLACRWHGDLINPPDEELSNIAPLEMLESVDLRRRANNLDEPGSSYRFYEWLADDIVSGLETQRFGRQELADWLVVIGLPSEYSFIPVRRSSLVASPEEMQQVTESTEREIDPSDFPPELDAANVAFRAISNGYGKSPSKRNRLIEYLQAHYPHFKPEQVKRIATVANPDKTTGRKKHDKG